MQLSRFIRHAQRLAGSEQMLLSDDFVEVLRPHHVRQRRRRLPRFKQIAQDEDLLATEDSSQYPLGGYTEFTEKIRIGMTNRKKGNRHWHDWISPFVAFLCDLKVKHLRL